MVPRSPIEHPNKHHEVFFALLFHVCLQRQLKVDKARLINKIPYFLLHYYSYLDLRILAKIL